MAVAALIAPSTMASAQESLTKRDTQGRLR
jgi:hypothetical protein